MDHETIKTIIANKSKMTLPAMTEITAEINQLETEFGLQLSPKFYNMSRGLARLEELKTIKASVAAQAPARVTAAAPAVAATSAPAVSTDLLMMAAKAIQPGHGFWQLSPEEQRPALAHFFHVRHLTYPGIGDDVAKLPAEKQRKPNVANVGLERMARAASQKAIDKIILGN
ncbi:MAG: hypothetical protein QM813_10890 [Verrucomicrobiota bacterium]